MLDRVDLLLLNVSTPLADAVCATACSRWQEAADLWLDTFREPRYRTLAALCGLEATLHAGLYDLAHYFYLGIDEHPSLPDFLVGPWHESVPIRRKRARFYARNAHASAHANPRQTIQHLIELRLYREAIRDIFARRHYQGEPATAVPQLAACYFALGEHEALIALHSSQKLHFVTSDVRIMFESAEANLALATAGAVDNALQFARWHPAGRLLAALMETPESAFVLHG